MDTAALKKFAPAARTLLIDDVTSRLSLVLAEGSAARREHPAAVRALEGAIARDGRAQVIERVAYTWFNRFTALRFMDVHGYTGLRTVSPVEGQTRPEILSEAMAGHIDDAIPERIRARVAALLDGRIPSAEPQAEAYRLLLVAVCNTWHATMPYMFERIDDFTELLMPGDLLSPTSILANLRAVMTDDACADVEIIGWLYQFYISEKKDQVFAGLKKNIKITAENIPAATQLFTPHWIVRYLVENSLGRLWLLNRSGSRLAERMDYYIAPEDPETNFLRIARPEDIRICDPACGSGHMLTYAFDLLYAIYEEEGYEAVEIPGLILAHNLHGIEIDDRAGALAAFALAMKAAAKLGRRRFLRMKAQPNIVVLQNFSFTPAEMTDVTAVVGLNLFTAELRETLAQFGHAKNFGSLIVPKLWDTAETLRVVEARVFGDDMLLMEMQNRVAAVLRMAEALSPKYHVVVANPPYMGRSGMNDIMKKWISDNHSLSKSDLMTCFMDRSQLLTQPSGFWAMLNLPSWMFLSSFEGFRASLLAGQKIDSLLQLGRGIFGADFGTVAFVVRNCLPDDEAMGVYRRLFTQHSLVRDVREIERAYLDFDYNSYRVRQADFLLIPGSPLAYWLSEALRLSFANGRAFETVGSPRVGMQTSNNDRFLRLWYEINNRDFMFGNPESPKWIKYVKGGEFRRWYGNLNHILYFNGSGSEILTQKNATVLPLSRLTEPKATWTSVTSGRFNARLAPTDSFHDIGGHCFYPNQRDLNWLLGFSNTKQFNNFLSIINPTLNYQVGDVARVPLLKVDESIIGQIVETLVIYSKSDWNGVETSWDFTTLPLLSQDHRAETLEATYVALRAHWQGMTAEMKRLEEENNRVFISAYGLQDELSPEVPVEEITLTCNPAYRYGVKIAEDERETRLRADTMAEFLHYAVGCMLGRYSLDAPGLILANRGEGLADYLARIPAPSFAPDANNVIPMLDADWFPDDVTERFRKFLRVTFGEDRFRENLRFIEDSLGKDIRRWFTKDFFDYHVRRYKKRPIYWLFASPKGSFQALIYMHRYRPDTVSVLLNDYVREFITKLQAERRRLEALADDPAATQAERTRAVKDTATIARQLEELTAWERDVVFPLAQRQIPIDLDDGVKANYPKFAPAVKPIKGLEDADE